MDLEACLREFLTGLRDEVCSRCGGRPPGDPGRNPCCTTLPLGQLVEALRQAHTAKPAAGPAAGWCPCAMEKLASLAREAAECLEQRWKQREHLLDLWEDD
jgi:hypothetical protein